jgi:hypothetical protein
MKPPGARLCGTFVPHREWRVVNPQVVSSSPMRLAGVSAGPRGQFGLTPSGIVPERDPVAHSWHIASRICDMSSLHRLNSAGTGREFVTVTMATVVDHPVTDRSGAG